MNRHITNSMRVIALASFLCMSATEVAAQQDMFGCGSLENAYGPFDYTNASHRREKLQIVEVNHFDSAAESLRGHKGVVHRLPSDLDYTLRAFPNHHRALYTMMQYELSDDPRHKTPLLRTADCYFKRAKMMQPVDGKTSLIFGIYKARTGDFAAAQELFQEAEQLLPDSAEVIYNIGLMYAKQKHYDEAMDYARRAYALGYPLPGLRNILKRAGKWQD